MMRRSGKTLEGCDTYGRAPGVELPYDPRPPRREPSTTGQLATGLDFDLFTGR